MPPGAGLSPEFLRAILAEAVAAAVPEELPIVLLVDALDEADDPPPGVNRLLLPESTPDGVYIVATVRRGVDPHLHVLQQADAIVIDENSEDNRRDVLAYVDAFVERNAPPMAVLLEAWKVEREQFARLLLDKSEGNFMYLRHVLPELLRKPPDAAASEATLADLPQGLRGYYDSHWDLVAGRRRQERLEKAVIGVLAVAREPVDVEQVLEWVALGGLVKDAEPDEIEEVLRKWAQFLQVERAPTASASPSGTPPTPAAAERYRIYHASFVDYLKNRDELRRPVQAIAAAMEAKTDWDEV